MDDDNTPDESEAAGQAMLTAIRDWVASAYEPEPCVVTRFFVIAECDDGNTRWIEFGGYSADGHQLQAWEASGMLNHVIDTARARLMLDQVVPDEGDE